MGENNKLLFPHYLSKIGMLDCSNYTRRFVWTGQGRINNRISQNDSPHMKMPSSNNDNSRTYNGSMNFDSKNNIKILTLNCQSCREVASEISDIILNEDIDIALLTETWLRENGDEAYITTLTPNTYEIFSFPRLNPTCRSGGSIAILMKKSISKHAKCKRFDNVSIEGAEVSLTFGKRSTTIVCIYHRTSKATYKVPHNIFFDEFGNLLSYLATNKADFSIHGDFNFHYDNQSSSDVAKLMTMLDDFSLCQLISEPTHRKGHILDWIITRSQDSLLTFDDVKEYPSLSDHKALFSHLNMAKPSVPTREVSSRNIKGISHCSFSHDLNAMVSNFETSSNNNADTLANAYNESLRSIIDKHAPILKRTVKDRHSSPYMNDEVREARRVMRRAERKWRKRTIDLHIYRDIYKNELKKYNKIKEYHKKQHITSKIESCTTQKQIFVTADELLGKKKTKVLPTIFDITELPEKFSQYFSEKVKSIRDELDKDNSMPLNYNVFEGPYFSYFQEVTVDDVIKTINSMPTKTCSLDPIPTEMTKQYLHEISPLITTIINTSLSSGKVPITFKKAIVIPLLKKKGLDQNVLKNYRPVSNLPFIAKVLERIVLKQLQNHLNVNDLVETYQAAYRSAHSTETAVLGAVNNLLLQNDLHNVSAVGLLDLSAAFDTLDHTILLKRLEFTFGIKGTVLEWF